MKRFTLLGMACLFLLVILVCHRLDLCASLNGEGRALLRFKERVVVDPYGSLSNWVEGSVDHCSWFGVKCSDDGRVVSMNLENLLLEGTLAPELGNFIHLKSLILRNNSFCGTIPKELGALQKLEILDLGYNNLGGPFPSEISSTPSLKILVLKHNGFMGNIPLELEGLNTLSEYKVDEAGSSSTDIVVTRNIGDATIRKLLQVVDFHKSNHRHRSHINTAPALAPSPAPTRQQEFPKFNSHIQSPSPSLSPSPNPQPPSLSPSSGVVPSSKTQTGPDSHSEPAFPVKSSPSANKGLQGKQKNHWIIFSSVAAAFSIFIVLATAYFLCFRKNKVVSVMPWRTGLSGQLQKAFVTGVPSLKRSELESACEDFSNVVGSLSDCFLYKGTLSSGVEIAVTSTMVTSAKDWSVQYEAQFRKKISVLSKVNHKNFMNLIGYCEEEEPFTRMMVYEYAPNGTLFEHLHIKEADHLDWTTRLRTIMGVAYCLDHMHQLDPPVVLKNLQSSSIYLCDDYAAKITDLTFSTEETETEASLESSGVLDTQLCCKEFNVYKFGIILLETISGRLPFSEDDGLLVLWASSHLNGKRPLMDMVDSTLESFNKEEVIALSEVIKSCISLDPKKRPTMNEVVARLRKITGIAPDAATPKLSPLWWAELEIISTECNSLL